MPKLSLCLRRAALATLALGGLVLPGSAAAAGPAPASATGSADDTPPLVTFRALRSGAVVTRRQAARRCRAITRDSGGVRYVDFLVDGRFLRRDRKAPYTCAPSRLSGGRHLLEAHAVDRRYNVRYEKVAFAVVARRRIRRAKTPVAAPAPAPAPVAAPTEPAPAVTRALAPPPPPAPTEPATTPSPAPSPLVFADSFDAGDFSAWQMVQSAAADRISTVTSPVASGGRSARFEVRGPDRWNGTARSEIGWTTEMAAEGMTRTYSWKTRFDANFPTAPWPAWQSFLQWKNEGTGTPPIAMKIEGDDIMLQTGPQHSWKTLWRAPLERDRWLDFKVRVHWSEQASTGWVEVVYNGQTVLGRTPVQTLYPGLKNYLKMGLYRSETFTETGVVHHDDLRVSAG